MRENNSGFKFSFIIGVLLGAAALMLAPASGKKMRKMAVNKSKNAFDNAKDKLSDLDEDYVEPNLEKMKDNIDLTVDTVKEKTEDLKDGVSKQILNFRSRINSGKFDN